MLTNEVLITHKDSLILLVVLGTNLPDHVKQGVKDILAHEAQSVIGMNSKEGAEKIVASQRETFNSYKDELDKVSMTAEQVIMILLVLGIATGDWQEIFRIFSTGKIVEDESILRI